MSRNLKAFGFALCAALVLGAVAAQAASAVQDKFYSSSASGETFLTFNQAAGEAGDQVYEATTGEHKALICGKVTAKTSLKGSPIESVTLEPVYTECGIWETKEGGTSTETAQTKKLASAKVITTNCHYKLTGVTTSGNPTGGEHATVHIEERSAGSCTHIKFKVSILEEECISIPVQEVTDAVRYNTVEDPVGSGKTGIEIKATAHSIKTTTTNHPVCPTGTGGTVVHETHETGGKQIAGSYTGTVNVTGYEDSAHTKQVSIEVK